MKKQPYYITTPIYYVTDKPHIGHLYTTVAADVMARYQRMRGKEVLFLTGTDEHGQKIQKKAKESGETPIQLADRVVERYREAWKFFDITFDDFIRTTEERHKKVVTEYVERLMKTGDIYLAEYEGWYCVPDESYWAESQVIEGKCPDCGRPLERLKEESYFFKMSAYQEKLLAHIEKHPDFIVPETRKNEVLAFVKQGLRDISVSRTTLQSGILMPTDPKATKEHRVYVWFDALTNYVSALSPLESDAKLKEFWPVAIHLVGKDILRFHAVYWPTFLMALGMSVPRKIVAHGWLTNAAQKMSKSLGNVVDPIELGNEVGVEALRFFLFREFTFGLDGEYTKQTVYQRINSDLANDYGNCINRLTAMIGKYLGDGVLDTSQWLTAKSEVRTRVEEAIPVFHDSMEAFQYHKALEALWKVISEINRHIESNAPWTLAKSDKSEDKQKLIEVLGHCLEGLRVVSILVHPYMPSSTIKALTYLGDEESLKSPLPTEKAIWAGGPKIIKVQKAQPLFPRLEWKEPTP